MSVLFYTLMVCALLVHNGQCRYMPTRDDTTQQRTMRRILAEILADVSQLAPSEGLLELQRFGSKDRPTALRDSYIWDDTAVANMASSAWHSPEHQQN